MRPPSFPWQVLLLSHAMIKHKAPPASPISTGVTEDSGAEEAGRAGRAVAASLCLCCLQGLLASGVGIQAPCVSRSSLLNSELPNCSSLRGTCGQSNNVPIFSALCITTWNEEGICLSRSTFWSRVLNQIVRNLAVWRLRWMPSSFAEAACLESRASSSVGTSRPTGRSRLQCEHLPFLSPISWLLRSWQHC